MKTNPTKVPDGRIEREVERERHERMLNDEARAGLASPDDWRTKDARENAAAANLRRPTGR
jgi:hypothetical protein